MSSRLWMISLLCACGSNNTAVPDAAIDAAHPDAAADAATDGPTLPVGAHHHYVIDHENVPANNNQARQYGLDLNNDAVVDNQLGQVLATFGNMGLPIQLSVAKAVDTGETLLLADLQATDLVTATSTGFAIFFGQNPQPAPCTGSGDTVCRHHLAGTGMFTAAAMPRDTALTGAAVGGTFTQGAGHLSIQVAMFGPTPTVRLDLIGARVQLSSVTASAIGSGVIAGAVTQTDVDTKVIPALQQSMVPIIARDCSMLQTPPSCGCTSSTQGQNLLGLFDTAPKDCMITVAEIQNNSLIHSLLAPDVTIDGQMALSFGMGITATGATFTP